MCPNAECRAVVFVRVPAGETLTDGHPLLDRCPLCRAPIVCTVGVRLGDQPVDTPAGGWYAVVWVAEDRSPSVWGVWTQPEPAAELLARFESTGEPGDGRVAPIIPAAAP